MDAVVHAAMRKWPDVPDVYNWLLLDERGRYRIRARDYEFSRRFDAIVNQKVLEFIGRNYQSGPDGRWYFQNGPQRVFVTFAVTPWVYRFNAAGAPVTQVGHVATRVDAVLIDEHATPILATDLGPGMVDDRDLPAFLGNLVGRYGEAVDDEAIDRWIAAPSSASIALKLPASRLPVQTVERATLGGRFGFVRAPQPPAGANDC